MRLLVTGAYGFVGSAVAERALAGMDVTGSVRRAVGRIHPGVSYVEGCELTPNLDWTPALAGTEAVVHAAAHVHVEGDAARDSDMFRRLNVESTLNLAKQARAAGVRRFVFLSTVAVHGNETLEAPFDEASAMNPPSAYAASKLAAEHALSALCADGDMRLSIVRPPMVYGPDAPGNFDRMMRVLARGLPLPLGAIHNRRSLVAVDNLADFVLTCVRQAAATNEAFLVSDADDVSTTELLRRASRALGTRSRLVPVPAGILRLSLSMLGRDDLAKRLCHSLQVDITKARTVLGWLPPVDMDTALRAAAARYRDRNGITA